MMSYKIYNMINTQNILETFIALLDFAFNFNIHFKIHPNVFFLIYLFYFIKYGLINAINAQ